MISVVCDLDGVIYRGQSEVGDSGRALRALREQGLDLLFVTNNSTRSPQESAAKIERVTGFAASPDQVLTSSVAAASMIDPADGPALVLGEAGVFEALGESGISVTDDPEAAGVVVVGLYEGLSYGKLSAGVSALHRGARFVATNADPTFPTESGFLPGAGAIVAALAAASGREPEIAGKPHESMRNAIRERLGGEVVVVGDRIDTDIRMASLEESWRSILVLTGVTALGATSSEADYVVEDFAEAANLVLSGFESG